MSLLGTPDEEPGHVSCIKDCYDVHGKRLCKPDCACVFHHSEVDDKKWHPLTDEMHKAAYACQVATQHMNKQWDLFKSAEDEWVRARQRMVNAQGKLNEQISYLIAEGERA